MRLDKWLKPCSPVQQAASQSQFPIPTTGAALSHAQGTSSLAVSQARRDQVLHDKPKPSPSKCLHPSKSSSKKLAETAPTEATHEDNRFDTACATQKELSLDADSAHLATARDSHVSFGNAPPSPSNLPRNHEKSTVSHHPARTSPDESQRAQPPAKSSTCSTVTIENRDITLTDEQQQILEIDPFAPDKLRSPPLVIICAAAGSAKSTTLLLTACKLIAPVSRMQGKKIVYTVFNNQGQRAAKERFDAKTELTYSEKSLIDFNTVHSLALRAAKSKYRWFEVTRTEDQYQKAALKFLGPVVRDLEWNTEVHMETQSNSSKRRRPRGAALNQRREPQERILCGWIIDTLKNWVQSDQSFEQFDTKFCAEAAVSDFDKRVARRRLSMLGSFRKQEQALEFIVRQAKDLWVAVTQKKLLSSDGTTTCFSHDVYMKLVQLDGLQLTGYAVMLIDEAQDLTDCQLDWLLRQHAHVPRYCVGDPNQRIYSFRGVKDSFPNGFDDLRPIKLALTRSFRFGQAMADIGNAIIQIKAHSNQGRNMPVYHVIGAGEKDGAVSVNESAAHDCRNWPITCIARTNVKLIEQAVSLCRESNPRPRISLLGTRSAMTFQSIARQAREAYVLWNTHSSDKLPPNSKLREFDSWDEYSEHSKNSKQDVDLTVVTLVEKQQHGIHRFLEDFERSVLSRPTQPEQADVLLTTVHQAKGLQWPRVQVHDDLLPLDGNITVRINTMTGAPELFWAANIMVCERSGEHNDEGSNEFRTRLVDFEDDALNLWYVAVTRATDALFLPCMWIALEDAVMRVISTCACALNVADVLVHLANGRLRTGDAERYATPASCDTNMTSEVSVVGRAEPRFQGMRRKSKGNGKSPGKMDVG